jgi:UDP-N-acetylglucosamine 1-carboxyvinyltransferase
VSQRRVYRESNGGALKKVASYKCCVLQSPDIRAGLAFLIAANVANGKSTIGNAYLIDRGYEKIELRLREIGVDIKRISV